MQLDRTQIAIRERSGAELLDLSLLVTGRYFGPLLLTLGLGVLPLMLLNYWLIGWMGWVEYGAFQEWEDVYGLLRYTYNMAILVFLEAQLASVFLTALIGQAVFLERPKLREVARDVLSVLPQLTWYQGVLRAVIAAWLLALMINRDQSFTALEIVALPALVLYAGLVRSIRPYINEIIILERNPFRARDQQTITVGRRSRSLHAPEGGELFGRWLGAAVVGMLLCLSLYGSMLFASGVFLNDWGIGPILMHLGMPLAMWLVVGFLAVYRFLSYLDLRIRLEGWEVELKMRAEAARFATHSVSLPPGEGSS